MGQAVNCSSETNPPPENETQKQKKPTLADVISGTTTSKKQRVLTKKICKNVCGRGPKVLATEM